VFCLVTNKIYKSEIIKKNNIKFNKQFSIGEDLNFNLKVFNIVNNFYFDTNFYYSHCERNLSLSFKFHEDYLKISYKNVKLLNKVFKNIIPLKDKALNDYKKYILNYTLENYNQNNYNKKTYEKLKNLIY